MPRGNILIVEDEVIISGVIEHYLTRNDFKVVAVVDSAEKAVEKALELKPDLILVDILLKGKPDGIQAVEKIISLMDVPVIYLTAYTDDTILEQAKKTQPYGYIPKPFQEAELKTSIEMALYKHQMETQLRKSESRFRSIFENSLDTIFISTPQGRFVEFNPAAVQLFGYSKEELAAINIADLYLDAHDRGRFQQDVQKQGYVKDYEVLLKKKDDTVISATITATVISEKDGTVMGYQGFIRDITEKKKREEMLNILQSAVNASTNALLITDQKGTILFVNPAFQAMTGYSAMEVLGKNPRLLKSGSQPVKVYRELWQTITSGRSWSGELINKKREGSLYTQRCAISPVFDPSGKISHFIGIATDITQEKKLEQQLLQAVKMDSLGRLAGGIAHDFNNLLTIINGYTEMMLASVKEPKNRENLQEILKAGEKAAKLTSQILAFSRQQMSYPQIVNINEGITEFQKMIKPIIGEDIKLNTQLSPNLAYTRIDSSQLEQIIMNIVVNARDSMPNGGELVIQTDNFIMNDEFVEKHMGAKKGKYVMLSISDTGSGMDEYIQKRVFEPFFTTKRKGEGTGLGLSTVYGIVKQNNGYISVYSTPGKGSTFKVFLPLYQVTDKPLENFEVEKPIPSFQDKVVLLVEDEEQVRQLTSKILRSFGFSIIEAANGFDAVKLAENTSQGIDLILTDLVMPGMSGREVAERLLRRYPQARVLFTSGYPEKDVDAVDHPDSKVGFIAKPFSRKNLLKKIEKLWEV